MMCRNGMVVLLLLSCLFFNVSRGFSFEGFNVSLSSDENTILRNLAKHMEQTDQQLEELKKRTDLELKEVKEQLQSCNVKQNELRHIIDSLTQSSEIFSSTPLIPTDTEKVLVLRSCAEWKEHGFTSSGTYTVDPDEQGKGEPPFSVDCNMQTGTTSLKHDLEEEITANQCTGPSCFNRKPIYEASEAQIKALIENSRSCQQFIEVNCNGSPFEDEEIKLSWWTGSDGEKHYEWAGEEYPGHTCRCGNNGTCVNQSKPCNCDAGLPNVWLTDKGYVSNKSALPIEEVTFGTKNEDSLLQVKIFIGPLTCQDHGHAFPHLPYPNSCLDLFPNGIQRNGWYIVGQPEALRATFCSKESRPDDEVQTPPSTFVDIDLGNLVLRNLQSKGFIIPRAELFDEMQMSFDELNNLNSNHNIVKRDETSFFKYTSDGKARKPPPITEFIINVIEETLRRNRVVFHANFVGGTVNAWSDIEYDAVNLNVGEGFDASVGKFRVPIAGLYYLEAQANDIHTGETEILIRVDQWVLSKARSEVPQTLRTSVILNLNAGDEVSVSVSEGVIDGDWSRKTSFMGFLIY